MTAKKKNKKKKYIRIFQVLYLLLALLIVFGEFQRNVELLSYSRPFLLPALFVVYFFSSKKLNSLYLTALTFAWLANIFFINLTEIAIMNGGICYFLFWIVMTYVVLVNTSFPNGMLFTIAIVPFLLIYSYVLQLVYFNIFEGVPLYLLHGFFMVFLGGYTLASYFMNSNKINAYLLIAVLLFTVIQIVISIDLYYMTITVFRPIAFVLYAAGQVILLRVMLLFEQTKMEVIQ